MALKWKVQVKSFPPALDVPIVTGAVSGCLDLYLSKCDETLSSDIKHIAETRGEK